MNEELGMEDNDKRNSSTPSAPSGTFGESQSDQPAGSRRRDSQEPEMFDQHEQTLPRFTIDPGEAPLRQRTRTLLGVPTLVTEEEAQRASAPPQEMREPAATSGKLASAIFDAHDDQEPATTKLPEQRAALAEPTPFDLTVDIVEDDLNNEITMVSDADVVALPDITGQLQPVRLEDESPSATGTAAAAAIAARANRPEREQAAPAATAAAFAPTAPHPSSLAPREIARPAEPPKPARESSSNRWGALLVAAVMLLATGAWFLTAGTFRRATLSEAAQPSTPTTAATSQPTHSPNNADPMANQMANQMAKTEEPAPPPSEAPAPAAEAPSSAPAPASVGAVPGPGIKKQALTASARGERTRSTKARKPSAANAPAGDMPEGPTRTEVITRLQSVRPAVQVCAAGRSGVADLDITIAHTGVVMHVLVGGDFAGTTEGSCIARAVRQAKFPAFKQERFRLLYPYAI
jgi:hypothetical protein